MLALLFRPWCLLMDECKVTPRILADAAVLLGGLLLLHPAAAHVHSCTQETRARDCGALLVCSTPVNASLSASLICRPCVNSDECLGDEQAPSLPLSQTCTVWMRHHSPRCPSGLCHGKHRQRLRPQAPHAPRHKRWCPQPLLREEISSGAGFVYAPVSAGETSAFSQWRRFRGCVGVRSNSNCSRRRHWYAPS